MQAAEKNFIVYKASAGSGKTFQLVNEYLTLCLKSDSRFYFTKILAITFTNKAAAEMKERILDHLRILSSSGDSPDFKASILTTYRKTTSLSEEALRERAIEIREAMLHHYTSLSVCTIDKFTHKLIRSFARDLKLSADFTIESDPEVPLEKCVDEIISLAGQEENITEVLEKYIQFLTDQGENWNVEKMLNKFGKQLLDEEAASHLENLRRLSHEEFKKSFSGLTEKIKATEKKLSAMGDEFVTCFKKNQFSNDHFKGKANGIHRHFRIVLKKDFLNKAILYSETDVKNLAAGDIFNKEWTNRIPEDVKTQVTEMITGLHQFLEKEYSRYTFLKLVQKNIYNLALIEQLSDRLNTIKQTENTILIGEFNRLISDTIKNDPAPFIYERIGERYHHILIDEFQDTSRLQFTNLLPLIENGLSNGKKCLLVGDPKQAIYRWRSGDVDQFIQLPALSDAASSFIKESVRENYQEADLIVNRRSGRTIVDFNNHFFNLASEKLDPAYRGIYSTLKQEAVHEGGYVELTISDKEEPHVQEKMLGQIMDYIVACKKDGYRHSDIAILVRGNKEGALIAGHLHQKGIPVESKESLLLSSSTEVQLVMYFIRYLAWPFDPVAGFKIIELNEYLKGNTDENFILKYQSPFHKNHFDVIRYFEEVGISFNRNRFLNASSYHLILESIAMFFSSKTSVYLRFLAEYVFNTWKNKPVDAIALCEWWDENKPQLSIRTSGNHEAIKILTIHASKGLQFPVAIVAFADWKIKNGREWIWIETKNDEFPIGTTLVKSNASLLDTTQFQHLKSIEKSKSLLDDLNLLYVAFTRPEERLYILARDKEIMKNFRPQLESVLTQIPEKPGMSFAGEKAKHIVQAEPQKDALKINYTEGEPWDKRLRLSLGKYKNTEEQENEYLAKISGILLHGIFEKTDSYETALEMLRHKMKSDFLLAPLEEELKKELQNTYLNKDLLNLKKNLHVMSECTIVDISGHSYRPDKVFTDGKNITILDFKTGSRKESHMEQIQKYGELFNQMNYLSVKKYLFYTKESSLIQV